MAYTATKLIRNIQGNKVVEYWDVTADAASGTIATGLSVIEAIAGAVPVSAATAAPKFKQNIGADGSTATNGTVFVSSAASGDHFVIIAIGH